MASDPPGIWALMRFLYSAAASLLAGTIFTGRRDPLWPDPKAVCSGKNKSGILSTAPKIMNVERPNT